METQNIQTAQCNLLSPLEKAFCWPKLSDFADPPPIAGWRDIPIGVYRPCEIQDLRVGYFGPCLVLCLSNKCCDSNECAAPLVLCSPTPIQNAIHSEWRCETQPHRQPFLLFQTTLIFLCPYASMCAPLSSIHLFVSNADRGLVHVHVVDVVALASQDVHPVRKLLSLIVLSSACGGSGRIM